jgi:hypothetical protein
MSGTLGASLCCNGDITNTSNHGPLTQLPSELLAHQPQGSGSPASEIRLPASTVRLITTCHQDRLTRHLPPCQSPYETSLHTAVRDRHASILTAQLLYIQLSETDMLLSPLHAFFTLQLSETDTLLILTPHILYSFLYLITQ